MEISGLFIFRANPYFFFTAFSILGAGIKYVDDAFDEDKFNKRLAVFIAPILGVLWAYTSLSNRIAATMLLAVLVGVFAKGKIDNIAHQLGFITILTLLLLAGVKLMVAPLLVLSVAGILDEIGNDKTDKKPDWDGLHGKFNKFAFYFFQYRCLMKVMVLGITLAGIFPLYLFAAFIMFDGAYHLMRLYSRTREKTSIQDSYLEIDFE